MTKQDEPIKIELPSIFPVKSVNAWLFKDPEPVLIDCGEKTDLSWNALEKGLKREGLSIADLKKVIITHGHLDHMGMANRITQHSDAEIWVNEYNVDWAIDLKKMLILRQEAFAEVCASNLSSFDRSQMHDFGYKALAPYWDEIPENRLKVFPVDGTLELGGNNWQSIYVPGPVSYTHLTLPTI